MAWEKCRGIPLLCGTGQEGVCVVHQQKPTVVAGTFGDALALGEEGLGSRPWNSSIPFTACCGLPPLMSPSCNQPPR